MPSGGQFSAGSGIRLQAQTPGVVDVGNENISGHLIAGEISTDNAPSLGAPGSNLIVGRNYTRGADAAQQLTIFGNNCKNGLNPGDFSPQFSTIVGFGASSCCQAGVAIGYSAAVGISRGNVNQNNQHVAVGSYSIANGEASDFNTFGNTCLGASCASFGRRIYAFGWNVLVFTGAGNQDVVAIGSNITNTAGVVNILCIRSADATKTLTASDNNSIIIGEPTQTVVKLGPYTISSGISAAGFLQTASATVGNTVAETNLTAAGVGSLTIGANRLVAGSTVRVEASGFLTDILTPTLQLKLKINGVVVCNFGAVVLPALAGTQGWKLNAGVTCRTTGAPGTCFAQGQIIFGNGLNLTLAQAIGTATAALMTSSNQLVELTAQWGTANAANSITCTNLTMEIVG